MAARQFAKVWLETTYGTFAAPGSPVKNTDYIVPHLHDANVFTMRVKPVQQVIRGAGSFNRREFLSATQATVQGSLQTYLFPEQANFLMNWSAVPVSNDLKSCTIDHAIVMDDASNTIVYRRYLGVKVAQMQLSASSESPLFALNLDLIGQKPASPNITVTDFPEPAFSQYPATVPYAFPHMSSPGLLSLGSTRTEFSGWELTIKNMLDGPFNESQYISRLKYCGRDVDWTDRLLYKTAADRASLEASTATTCSARIDNGTSHVIFDFKTNGYATDVTDDLALDKVHFQAIQWSSFHDASATSDLAITVV